MYTPLDILSAETWILLITIGVLCWIYIRRKWSVLKKLNIPHDPPSILGLGNMAEMIKNPDFLLTGDTEQKKKYGKIYGAYAWLTPRLIIWDTDILKHIFIKEYSNFPDRQKAFTKVGGKELNTSLTSVSGVQWKRIRHSLSPLFSGSKLKGMVGIIDNCAEKLVNNLEKVVKEKDGRFNPKELFGNFSMDVICSAAFCVRINSQDGKESKEVEMAKKLFGNAFFKNPWFWLITLIPPLERVVAKFNITIFEKSVVDYFKRLTLFLIKNKSPLERSKNEVDFIHEMLKVEVADESVKEGLAKGLTRTEILGNSVLMILASYENVANSLMSLAYCVAVYEGVQERLYEEIKENEENGQLTYDGINKMNYLDLCLKEALRLYNPSPRNARFCESDITIKGLFIPAGMTIEVPVYAMSHDEEYWDDPWEFKPERFEDMTKIDPMTYLPFGAGPRNCIGMRFALFEVKFGICKILQNFVLSPCEDTPKPPLQYTVKGNLRPKEEVFLRLTPRNSQSL